MRQRRIGIAVIFMLPLVTLAMGMRGCERRTQTPVATLPTTAMQLGGKTYSLEIAKTNKHREQGLMHRDSMPADHGMIFVFPDTQPRGFWMRNTRIPLDIIYVRPDGQIVSIHTMKPLDLSSVKSAGPAMYAIELNAGVAGALGLKAGDVLQIPPEAKEASE
jgi:uncharacterized membrane protein (UPF0127 family)